MGVNTNNILSIEKIILIFISSFLILFLISLIKKWWCFAKYKKVYHIFPQFSIKQITNIAMIISISIALILILSLLSSGTLNVFFATYPGIRISIEGVLIKIGGLLFGPIIGVFIGAITDLLTILISACSFHLGFFFVALFYGLISGLIKKIFNLSKNNILYSNLLISIILLSIFLALYYYINNLNIDSFKITFFSSKIVFTKMSIVLINSSIFLFSFLLIWILLLITYWLKMICFFHKIDFFIKYKLLILMKQIKIKNKQKFANWYLQFYANNIFKIRNKINKMNIILSNYKFHTKIPKLMFFSIILSIIVICETIVGIFFLPCFDIEFSIYPFSHWIVVRSFICLWLIFFNAIIIYPTIKKLFIKS